MNSRVNLVVEFDNSLTNADGSANRGPQPVVSQDLAEAARKALEFYLDNPTVTVRVQSAVIANFRVEPSAPSPGEEGYVPRGYTPGSEGRRPAVYEIGDDAPAGAGDEVEADRG